MRQSYQIQQGTSKKILHYNTVDKKCPVVIIIHYPQPFLRVVPIIHQINQSQICIFLEVLKTLHEASDLGSKF